MQTIKTIIFFVLMLSLITIVHELGHLLAAKAFGVYCKEFSIGMGPKLFSKKFKETEFCIRAFLIGGFVSMAGEENKDDPDIEELNIPKERTLKGIAKWKQFIVMFAGIFMNFVLSWLIYSLVIFNVGSYTVKSKPTINSIQENMPASESELLVGDIIEEVSLENGMHIKPSDTNELSVFLSAYYGGNGPWTITVSRDGKEYTYHITPTYYENEDRYIIGITFSDSAVEVVDINVLNCFKYGFLYMLQMTKIIITSFVGLFKGIGLNSLSGPVGVYKVVEEVVSYGFAYYLELLGLISINVAIFNSIPLPIFDGGRAFLLLIEAIIKKDIPKKVETIIFAVSIVLLLLLMAFVTYNDIAKIVVGG